MLRTEENTEQQLNEKLNRAVILGDSQAVKSLLEAKADKNYFEKDLTMTPLHSAVTGGHVSIVNLLLEATADVNAYCYSCTPLHCVAPGFDNLMIAKALLKANANKNAKDRGQDTPLHWAAKYHHKDYIGVLLESKADALAKNYSGLTAYDIAKDPAVKAQLAEGQLAQYIAADQGKLAICASLHRRVGRQSLIFNREQDSSLFDRQILRVLFAFSFYPKPSSKLATPSSSAAHSPLLIQVKRPN